MSLKEKMMESMLEKMTSEEKLDMMDKMMEKFFDGMTDEEKKAMMQNMMPKVEQIAEDLKLSHNSVIYVLSRLAKEGKIQLNPIVN